MIFQCQSYTDLTSLPNESDYDFFQVKYDGIWSRVVISGGFATVYSKTANVKETFATNFPDCIVVAEFMFGSEWSQAAGRKGKLFVFDLERFGENSLMELPYHERYCTLKNRLFSKGAVLDERFELVLNHRMQRAGDVWHRILDGDLDYEGLVFRHAADLPTSSLGRLKPRITDDVVILDAYEGEGKHLGRLGGFSVGKFKQGSGQLTKLYDVGGGFSDDQRIKFWNEWPLMRGRVIECIGRKRFKSGALRHPNFFRIRDDKLPSQCTFVP